MVKELPGCAKCPFELSMRICQKEGGKAPAFCPTLHRSGVIERSLAELARPEVLEFSRQASIQEGEGYADRDAGIQAVRPLKPRLLEIIEFAHRMHYQKIGLAFCMGLRNEARVFERLLVAEGFAVISGMCKMGGTPKTRLGLREDEQIRTCGFEPMCNPIAQAMLFNDEGTDFNIVMGLCVGHDSLFFKYAEAPTTVFAVKDRVLGHNPLAAVYTLDTYYRSLKIPLPKG